MRERYGNLFEMYERITDENPYKRPMRIYPAPHYAMGGLWVDYNLMTTIPGLYSIGESNFSDHGANRLGASALMQGLADGYFVLPYTIGDYLAGFLNQPLVPTDDPTFSDAESDVKERNSAYLASRGTRTVDEFHRQLGRVIWDSCGMARNEAGLQKAMSDIPALYDEFKSDVKVVGTGDSVNQTLEKVGRVEDYFQLAHLMCADALQREESCGAHLREEYQTEDGEAVRNDEDFSYVSAWEWTGWGNEPEAPQGGPRIRERQAEHEELQMSVTSLTLHLSRLEGATR